MTNYDQDNNDKLNRSPQEASHEADARTEEDMALGQRFKSELDTHLFEDIELDSNTKKEWMNMIHQTEAAAPKASWWTAGRKRMVTGAVAAAIMLGIGIPLFQSGDSVPIPGPGISQPGGTVEPAPGTNGGAAGPGNFTEVSPLVTEVVGSLEEAEVAFGRPILLPEGLLQGYELKEIAAVGYPEEDALRVHFQYEATDGGHLTFSVDKQEAVFPEELFTTVELGGTEGQVFAQPTLTELFWKLDDIQYSLMGTLTEEQAVALAQSTLS